MAYYLLQVAYSPEAWAAMVNNPQDRTQAVEGPIKKLGGNIERFWMSFGDYDVIGIVEMPDNVSTAAFSMAISAGGACKSVKTAPLMTMAEGVEAMRKAATCGYKPAKAAARAAR